MNIDNGLIRLWRDLTDDEKEGGRWVKLGDDEFATAATIEEKARADNLNEIFGKLKTFSAEHPFYGKPK